MLLSVATFVALFSLLVCAHRWYRKAHIDNFISKSVFITGTDSGFGLALALHLDKCGVKVYAGCYTKEGAENLKTLASDKLKTIRIDISKVESVYSAKDAVEKDLGPNQELWGLVNNAGLLNGQMLFPLISPGDYRLAMDVNFFGTMNVTNAFWPLIKRSSGRIVNVISMAGRISGFMEPYTCSKHALEPYSDGLRRWMRLFGAHVSIIEPGLFSSTNLSNNIFAEKKIEDVKENALPHMVEECGDHFINAVVKDIVEIKANTMALGQWNRPEVVRDAMTHALFAKHPKDRYVCGFDANFFFRIASMFPDWVSDFVISRMLSNMRHVLKTN